MKKGFIVLFAIFFLIFAFLFFRGEVTDTPPPEAPIIDDAITITQFKSGEKINSTAMVSISFLEARNNTRVSVSLDVNNDGLYKTEEVIISNVPIRAQKDWKNSFYFTAYEGLEGVTDGQVTINGSIYNVSVDIKTQDVGSLLELETITDPENAMKGIGVAYAQTDIEIFNDDVPDLNQRPGECAPTSAANGLIDLVRENGSDDQQLGDPNALIESLKGHMNWTRTNGVLPDNFVAGKNAWAAENNLPIETRKVGDTNGITTIEQIRDALENGDAVELRIKFANAGGTRVVGGHMVTVTGIHQDGDETHLDINDPATVDSGTESVEVSGNTFSDYGPWDGITVISWGFIQSWTDGAEETAGVTETSGTAVEEQGTESAVNTGESVIEESAPYLPSETGNPILDVTGRLETSFAHVKPGEYSEIYGSIFTTSGAEISAELKGGSVVGSRNQTVVADENGQARFVWRIDQYGEYSVAVDIDGVKFTNKVSVN